MSILERPNYPEYCLAFQRVRPPVPPGGPAASRPTSVQAGPLAPCGQVRPGGALARAKVVKSRGAFEEALYKKDSACVYIYIIYIYIFIYSFIYSFMYLYIGTYTYM